MKRLYALYALVFICASLAAQTAQYPSAIATDSNLYKMSDRADTTLLSGITAGSTSLSVASTATFTAPMIITIDNEQMVVTVVVNGTTLTVASRGFAGTSAASHLAAAKVQGRIVAWHHNALSAEVQALEQALGINLGTVDSKITARLLGNVGYLSSDYDFAPQTPGGSIAIGANAVNFAPVPKGTNGSDAAHYLYLSGGTGTAEACLITGGAGTAGSTTGQLILLCAHTHTGAWTVKSATAGIQEALQACVTGGAGVVNVPTGTFTTHAAVTNAGSGVRIRGAGRNSTIIVADQPNAGYNVFTIFSAVDLAANRGSIGNEISGMSIYSSGAFANGYAVSAQNQANFDLHEITAGTPYGFELNGVGYADIRDFFIGSVATGAYGIYLVGGTDVIIHDGFLGNADPNNPGFAALYFNPASVVYVENVDAIQFGKGVYIGPAGGQFIHFHHVTMAGAGPGTHTPWAIAPVSPGRVIGVTCEDCEAFDGLNDGVTLDSSAGSIYGFKWLGSRAYNNGAHGFHILGANTFDTQIVGGSIAGNGVVAGDEIRIGAAVTKVNIHGVMIGMADAPAADLYWNPTANSGVAIDAGAGDHITVTGNSFASSFIVQPLVNNATGTHNYIAHNAGIDTLVPPTVASGTTIALPLTGQSTFFVSGTTTITTINGGSVGQQIRIMKSDASSVTIGGGGNIPGSHTLAQYGGVALQFNGTNWY